MKKITLLLVSCSLLFQCQTENYSQEKHLQEVNAWHEKRMQNLRKKESWINLNGLFFLKEGLNTFGSDSSNYLVFPKEFPAQTGTLNVLNGQVTLTLNPTLKEKATGLTEGKIYDEKLNLTKTQFYQNHQWFVIKRNGLYAIRMRDFEHPNFAKLKPIERFPVSLLWRIPARFEPFDKPKTIIGKNVLNLDEKRHYKGALIFEFERKTYRILAEDYGDKWFLIFKDKTSGKETYGASRYLCFPAPDKKGNTFINFNQAYNPPCSFTEFATCLLPIAQNTFDFRIEAGEKFDPNWNE